MDNKMDSKPLAIEIAKILFPYTTLFRSEDP